MRRTLLTLAVLIAAATALQAADKYVKREVRGVWLATVFNIDWPSKQGITIAIRREQQNEMKKYLDILQASGLNAVYFQTRPMADAFYKSSYEPVSHYFTGTRGSRLPWDPLKFMVEECHRRGMECHAWVNPYRWKKSSNPEWNTRQDKELCHEMIEGYDIDGIIFDDYFYPSGMPTSDAAEDYDDWKSSGTNLSFGDWRRENVNAMVADVYNMIQELDPSIKFGISPAGAACSDPAVAKKHGVAYVPPVKQHTRRLEGGGQTVAVLSCLHQDGCSRCHLLLGLRYRRQEGAGVGRLAQAEQVCSSRSHTGHQLEGAR